jgi:hypothetical protein
MPGNASVPSILAPYLGKGEAVSSILTGSTRNPRDFTPSPEPDYAYPCSTARYVVAGLRHGLFGNCSRRGGNALLV